MTFSISREDFATTLNQQLKNVRNDLLKEGPIEGRQVTILSGGAIRSRIESKKCIVLDALHPSRNISTIYTFTKEEDGTIAEHMDTITHLAKDNFELQDLNPK